MLFVVHILVLYVVCFIFSTCSNGDSDLTSTWAGFGTVVGDTRVHRRVAPALDLKERVGPINDRRRLCERQLTPVELI
jgi:hypothetical protein